MQRGDKMSTKIPIESELKQYILTKYKSIRAFTQAAEIPYSTVDSMIKKGIDGTGINTISKICKTLSIDLESLASGRIVPIDEDNNTKTAKKRPMTFSEKLHRKRIESGLSIEELAEASGIDIEDLKRSEQGLQPNSVVKKLAKLAQILKVESIELLPDDDRLSSLKLADPGRSFISKPLTSDEKQLLNNYNTLNQQGKEKLIDYSDDLVGNSKYTDKQAK